MSFTSYLEDILDRLNSDIHLLENECKEHYSQDQNAEKTLAHINRTLDVLKQFSFNVTEIVEMILLPEYKQSIKCVELNKVIKENKLEIDHLKTELDYYVKQNKKLQRYYNRKELEVLQKERTKERGRISNIVDNKGYGFIKRKSSDDIFFHRTDMINEDEFIELKYGDLVEFDIEIDKRGDREKAIFVKLYSVI